MAPGSEAARATWFLDSTIQLFDSGSAVRLQQRLRRYRHLPDQLHQRDAHRQRGAQQRFGHQCCVEREGHGNVCYSNNEVW